MNGSTMGVSHFLDHLLRPTFDRVAKHTTIYNDTTKWSIGSLRKILDAILKLAHLVLDTNYFVYNNKYYRQIKGGAMGSPFTMTLANVYMLEWEQSLIESQFEQGELYGRYVVLTYTYISRLFSIILDISMMSSWHQICQLIPFMCNLTT